MEPPEILEERVLSVPIAEPGLFEQLLHDYALLMLIGIALVVNLALFGFLVLRYGALPDLLPMHFSAAGFPDDIEAKSQVFKLPIIGLLVFGLNGLLGVLAYRFERAATFLLGSGSLFVQLLMWLAAFNIAGGS